MVWIIIESWRLWLLRLSMSSLHSTFSSRTCTFSLSRLDLRWNVSSSFNWSVSCQIHSAIFSLSFVLNNWSALVSNKLAIRPVAPSQFGEHTHSLVTYLESTYSWYLSKIWTRFVIILNEIVVQIVMKVVLWNLILHDDGIWNPINNCSSLLLEEFSILSFVMTRIPPMSFAVLTSFYNKNYLILVLHSILSFKT